MEMDDSAHLNVEAVILGKLWFTIFRQNSADEELICGRKNIFFRNAAATKTQTKVQEVTKCLKRIKPNFWQMKHPHSREKTTDKEPSSSYFTFLTRNQIISKNLSSLLFYAGWLSGILFVISFLETLLPQCFVKNDSHGVGKVQGTRNIIHHGYSQAVVLPFLQYCGGRPAVSLPKTRKSLFV